MFLSFRRNWWSLWEVLESEFARKNLKQKSWETCLSPQVFPQLLFWENTQNTQPGLWHAVINFSGTFCWECCGLHMLKFLLWGKQSSWVSSVLHVHLVHIQRNYSLLASFFFFLNQKGNIGKRNILPFVSATYSMEKVNETILTLKNI